MSRIEGLKDSKSAQENEPVKILRRAILIGIERFSEDLEIQKEHKRIVTDIFDVLETKSSQNDKLNDKVSDFMQECIHNPDDYDTFEKLVAALKAIGE